MSKKRNSQREDALKAAFSLFDKNGDGSIEKHEIREVLSSMGVQPSETDLSDMIAECDVNGNGSIQFEEFIKLMDSRMQQIDELGTEELGQIFKMFDLDGNGLISPQELKEVMEKLGEKLTQKEIEVMVKEADKDSDGQINFEEFQTILDHM